MNKYGKTKCACCGNYTIQEIAETCPVCYWEENIYQEENIDDSDAPNYISLRQAMKNFVEFGAKRKELINVTRKPFQEEKE